MKKRSLLSLALLGCTLFSCVDQEVIEESSSSASISSGPRVYEAFGPYTAEQVEDICVTYAERVNLGYKPECCFIEYDLGVYGAAHVNIIKYVKEGKSEVKMEKTISLYGYYICTLPSYSYDLNVWIEGQGSFDLQRLYETDVITDDDIKAIIKEADRQKIRKGGTFDTKLEDFSFNLNWGYRFSNTYDSGTSLIKREGKTNNYTASFSYPNMGDIYQRVKDLDIYSYADEFRPGSEHSEGTTAGLRNTNYRYKLKIGDKTITCYTVRLTLDKSEMMRQEYRPHYRKFFELVIDIKDAIESSAEWNSMSIPEDDLLVDYG